MELNREQIIKALEFCANNDDCVGVMCPYYATGCENEMPKDALSLIKELTQANEQLSESYDHLEKTKDELLDERSRLTEENERLEKLSDDLGRDVDVKLKHIIHLENAYDEELDKLKAEKADVTYFKQKLIADTVRKMQERFKSCFEDDVKYDGFRIAIWIDQIAEEIINGN